MASVTSDEQADSLRKTFARVARQLSDLSAEMEELQERARAGELSAVSDAAAAVRQIRDWLKIATDMEMKLDDRDRKHGGAGAAGADFDLDGARDSIRCRLDRLRACHCPE